MRSKIPPSVLLVVVFAIAAVIVVDVDAVADVVVVGFSFSALTPPTLSLLSGDTEVLCSLLLGFLVALLSLFSLTPSLLLFAVVVVAVVVAVTVGFVVSSCDTPRGWIRAAASRSVLSIC